MNKSFALILLLFACLLVAFNRPNAVADAAPASGDCNGGGSINGADLTAARGHLYGNDGTYPTACDANGDGVLTSADLHCIRRLINSEACQSSNWDARLGTNLNAIVDFSPEYTFINAFKSSRFWTKRIDWSTWGDNLADGLDLDENGYPMSLPDPTAENPPYRYLATFLFKDIGGNYPGGRYHLYYDGQGTLGYGGDVSVDWGASSAGHHVLDVTPSNTGIEITISATDPNGTGDYIRNIRMLHEDFELGDDLIDIFHPDFISSISEYKTVRFMDWMRTNFSTQGARSVEASVVNLIDEDESSFPHATLINGHVVNTNNTSGRAVTERPGIDDAQYSTDKGAPVEVMVALANQVNFDPWFNMPHLATDDYVTDFATYVRDNLDPNQRVYVEYSNEIWNSIFTQYWWMVDQGKLAFPNADVIDQAKQLNFYGKRTHEVCEIWDSVFAAESDRIVCLINMQASNTVGSSWLAQQIIDCPLWTSGPCSEHLDAIAIAPYIGNYLSNQNSLITGWIDDYGTSGALDRLFIELTDGGQIPQRTTSGVGEAIISMDTYADLAASRGLDMISYEGGQHLHSTNSDVNQLFIDASNDARMEGVYDLYMAAWPEAGSTPGNGGKMFLHFNNTSKYGASGAWGSQESYADAMRPKLDALDSYNASAVCDWTACETVGTSISAELTLPAQSSSAGTNTVPIGLTTNAYDISTLAFALAYDDSKLAYDSVALVDGLSADFAINSSHSSGLLQVSVYPKTASAKVLPDGDIIMAAFTRTGSSAGDGVRFATEQVGGGSASLPATCGNDFGQALLCQTSGTALTGTIPTAVTVQQSVVELQHGQLVVLFGLLMVGTVVVFGRRTRQR